MVVVIVVIVDLVAIVVMVVGLTGMGIEGSGGFKRGHFTIHIIIVATNSTLVVVKMVEAVVVVEV